MTAPFATWAGTPSLIDDPLASLRQEKDGRYYLRTLHPYDLTEYHWARSDNLIEWLIVLDGRVAERFHGTMHDTVARLRVLDKAADRIPNIDKS